VWGVGCSERIDVNFVNYIYLKSEIRIGNFDLIYIRRSRS
jgi:hypothetical protein